MPVLKRHNKAQRSIFDLALFDPKSVILLFFCCATALSAQQSVAVDLASGWLRRDWSQCGNAAGVAADGDGLTIHSDSSAVIFWQIPTVEGRALELGADYKWVRQCDAPSFSFWNQLRKADLDQHRLVLIEKYPLLAWRWHTQGIPPEAACAVSLRVVITKKDTNELRELSYDLRCSLGTALETDAIKIEKRTIIPGLFSYKTAHFSLLWVKDRQRVERDLKADYKRAFPKETPGRVVRLLIKAESNPVRQRIEVKLDSVYFVTGLTR